MSWRLGNSIRLRSKTGLQLWITINDSKDINLSWENNKENIKISIKQSLGLYELKQHQEWSDEECLDQRKRVKIQWKLVQNKAM
jgi:hypothetical protein